MRPGPELARVDGELADSPATGALTNNIFIDGGTGVAGTVSGTYEGVISDEIEEDTD